MGNYAAIKNNDIDNGPGLRVSVWFSGCPHRCKGCHNEETWDQSNGKEFTDSTIKEIISLLDGGIKQNLSILGGEPLAPYNIEDTIKLIDEVKNYNNDIDIWIWTGYDIEELPEVYGGNIINRINADVIVDGRYLDFLKIEGEYYGSSNQRIINHKYSKRLNELILYEC